MVENIQSTNVALTSEEKKEINDFLDAFEVQGTRYPAQAMAHLVSLSDFIKYDWRLMVHMQMK